MDPHSLDCSIGAILLGNELSLQCKKAPSSLSSLSLSIHKFASGKKDCWNLKKPSIDFVFRSHTCLFDLIWLWSFCRCDHSTCQTRRKAKRQSPKILSSPNIRWLEKWLTVSIYIPTYIHVCLVCVCLPVFAANYTWIPFPFLLFLLLSISNFTFSRLTWISFSIDGQRIMFTQVSHNWECMNQVNLRKFHGSFWHVDENFWRDRKESEWEWPSYESLNWWIYFKKFFFRIFFLTCYS